MFEVKYFLHNIYIRVYCGNLWAVSAIVLMVLIAWSLLNRVCKGNGFAPVWKMINRVILSLSLSIIFYYTVLLRNMQQREIILLPFHFLIEQRDNPEILRSSLMNVFLFVPVGQTMSTFVRMKNRIPAIMSAAFIVSLAIELAQFIGMRGRFEVDDIMLNTLGAVISAFFMSVGEKKNDT